MKPHRFNYECVWCCTCVCLTVMVYMIFSVLRKGYRAENLWKPPLTIWTGYRLTLARACAQSAALPATTVRNQTINITISVSFFGFYNTAAYLVPDNSCCCCHRPPHAAYCQPPQPLAAGICLLNPGKSRHRRFWFLKHEIILQRIIELRISVVMQGLSMHCSNFAPKVWFKG